MLIKGINLSLVFPVLFMDNGKNLFLALVHPSSLSSWHQCCPGHAAAPFNEDIFKNPHGFLKLQESFSAWVQGF